MPLSKAKQAQYMREYRARLRYNVIPKQGVIPMYDWQVHKEGDVVRMPTGEVVTVSSEASTW